jgi:diguanylate cyclase
MQVPCVSSDDAQRVAALQRLGLLDTQPSVSFDRVTRLAAKALQVPIVLVSLVDQNRQWFKSRVGLEATETARDISFCGHAVFERRPLIIRDAALEARFAANPLVTGPPYIRAYLGIPLYTVEGYAIGTLCAIDRQPRAFPEHEVASLCDYAAIVQELIHTKELHVQTQDFMRFATERDALFRDAFDRAPIAILHTNLDGHLLRINEHARRLLGFGDAELSHLPIDELTHPDDAARGARLRADLSAGKIAHYRLHQQLLRKDGHYVWLDRLVSLQGAEQGSTRYLTHFLQEVAGQTTLKGETNPSPNAAPAPATVPGIDAAATIAALRAKIVQVLASSAAARKAEQRLQAITRNIPAMIGYWNRALVCEFANESYRYWYGLPPERVVGMTLPELIGQAAFAHREPHIRQALAGHPQRFESGLTAANGTPATIETRYLPDTDQSGNTRGFYVLSTDITAMRLTQQALEASNSKLADESTKDYLTGLFNRRYFTDQSEQAAARFRHDGRPYGLILMDLDDFKRINDHFGHDMGDEVLRSVGRILRDQLRERGDIVARLGGEELAILCCRDLDAAALRQIAERVRDQICKESVDSPRGAIRFTSSFGLALSHADDVDWKRIYARADAALYMAKAAGKNRAVFETEGVTGAAADRGAHPAIYTH